MAPMSIQMSSIVVKLQLDLAEHKCSFLPILWRCREEIENKSLDFFFVHKKDNELKCLTASKQIEKAAFTKSKMAHACNASCWVRNLFLSLSIFQSILVWNEHIWSSEHVFIRIGCMVNILFWLLRERERVWSTTDRIERCDHLKNPTDCLHSVSCRC